jgi:CHASE2 domain-containing sensor protein
VKIVKSSSFLHHLKKSWYVIVIVSLLNLYLEEKGWLRRFETAALDGVLLLKQTQPARHVVGITDEDYKRFFQSASPLNRETFRILINNIAQHKPKVIGIDIDTSDDVFKELELSPDWPPIVWAEIGTRVESPAGEPSFWELLSPFSEEHPVFTAYPALAGQAEELSQTTGIAIMPADFDMNIRHYNRQYRVVAPDGSAESAKDSFHWAIVKHYCASAADPKECRAVQEHVREDKNEHDALEDNLILNLSIDPYSLGNVIEAGDLIGATFEQSANDQVGGEQEAGTLQDKFKDKIVLIGGLYRHARDQSNTPKGLKSGVELWTQAIESELDGQGVRKLSESLLIGVEVLSGLFMVFLSSRQKDSWLMRMLDIPFLGLFAIAVFSIIFSGLIYSSVALWANFVPVMVAVYLHLYYDKFKHQREQAKEMQRLSKDYETLSKRLSDYEVAAAGSVKAPEPVAGVESGAASMKERLANSAGVKTSDRKESLEQSTKADIASPPAGQLDSLKPPSPKRNPSKKNLNKKKRGQTVNGRRRRSR